VIDLKSYVVTDSFFGPPYIDLATARAAAHRDGDVTATSRRIPNLAQARVIVS
jgi:hypothetical protein